MIMVNILFPMCFEIYRYITQQGLQNVCILKRCVHFFFGAVRMLSKHPWFYNYFLFAKCEGIFPYKKGVIVRSWEIDSGVLYKMWRRKTDRLLFFPEHFHYLSNSTDFSFSFLTIPIFSLLLTFIFVPLQAVFFNAFVTLLSFTPISFHIFFLWYLYNIFSSILFDLFSIFLLLRQYAFNS